MLRKPPVHRLGNRKQRGMQQATLLAALETAEQAIRDGVVQEPCSKPRQAGASDVVATECNSAAFGTRKLGCIHPCLPIAQRPLRLRASARANL